VGEYVGLVSFDSIVGDDTGLAEDDATVIFVLAVVGNSVVTTMPMS
jgi:hypothetical protein